MKYKYILFDLDGTLTDPKLGITKSVAYALKKMRDIEIEPNTLTKFIGPPLKDSFPSFYNFTEEETEQAISHFREYFTKEGIYENEIYIGMKEMLEKLYDSGKFKLAIATSKPTVFAEKIAEHFNIEKYFDCIIGSNLDNTRTKKADIIEEVFRILNIKDTNKAVMIGDREHDIVGANYHNIDSIGVKYGYGSEEELSKAGATYIVNDLIELKIIITS